jgi:protein-L-isoaspartate(D-aspartate) O-methyltransferase
MADLEAAKEQMLRNQLQRRGIHDQAVLAAMAKVPREQFVAPELRDEAYADRALGIDCCQTISQPYIVALMTQALELSGTQKVLEIGTGSGYQTAVLARLAKKVFTIERFSELAESAQAVLSGLGISNVEFCVGDGSCGWPASRLPPSGCFDRIMITAAVPEVPEPLCGQLAPGGVIVVPIGAEGVQTLVACEKKANKLIERFICDVRFVKLIGKHGFEE